MWNRKTKWITGVALVLTALASFTPSIATITNTSTQTVSALGNGSNKSFTIGFPFLDNNHIQVYLQDESATPYTRSLLVYGSGAGKYTITGGNPGTTVVLGTAPTASQRIIIKRSVPLTQTVHYDPTAAFPASNHEEAMDKTTMALQEFSTELGKKIGLSSASTAPTPTFPEPSAFGVIRWNSAGNNLETATADDLGIPIGSLSPVNISSPTTGQALVFDGTNWVNSSQSSTALNVAVTPSGNLSSSNAQAALVELQADIDTRALASDLTTHTGASSGAHAASAISNSPSGNLAATDVQAALNELQTDVDTRATSSALSTHIAATTSVHGIADTSALVTLTGSQTLTNKTLTTPIIDVAHLTDLASTPATPSAGTTKLYSKTDGKVYKLTSSGIETEIGAGGSGGGGALVVTGSRASPSSIVAGTGIAFTGTNARNLWFIQGSGGAVTVSANPQIAAGSTVGQELYLVGRSDTNTVTLSDGTGLSLNGPMTLYADSILKLFYDGTNWVELGRRL